MISNDLKGARLLDRAYEDLGYADRAIAPRRAPSDGEDPSEWLAVGDWLMLAERMGAERVFFVEDQPIVLFRQLPPGAGEAEIVRAYRSAWSLARAHCLFLATEDELRVYSLNSLPPRPSSEGGVAEPLEVVRQAADVAELLANYHVDQMESGAALEVVGRRGTRGHGHADRRLIEDVHLATRTLQEEGLGPMVSHALIERVLLVRYLEDRGVITPEYFRDIAGQEPAWLEALDQAPEVPQLGPASSLVSCLSVKELTYAVFDQLSHDFNGDLFVPINQELHEVQTDHLRLVRQMLSGEGTGPQQHLFLWAYDFSVVPANLISAMYEQFYRAGTDEDTGTYYTPPELVEHVLALAMGQSVLNRRPKVLDPACGSGIFLVEAYRRMVRHEMAEEGGALPPERLRQLLTGRISGIDLNTEAIRLAAFSLYLAFLNYQTPQDIRSAGPLPPLIHRGDGTSMSPLGRGEVLFVGDAFAPLRDEPPGDVRLARLPWDSHSFDVVVGNPPWNRPRAGDPGSGELWAGSRNLPYANRYPSHLFLWRSLSFVADDGVVALLVGAMALYSARGERFRREWLDHVELSRIVNFTAAREVFFSGGIAPFFLLEYGRAGSEVSESNVRYEAILPTRALQDSENVAYANSDRKWVRQSKLRRRDYLWKTYAWGDHRDDALLARLDVEKTLRDVLPGDPGPGYGYQRGSQRPSPVLASLPSLHQMEVWGPLSSDWFEGSPEGVKRQPDERRYEGLRIVAKRGAKTGFGPVARLEREPFSFRHIIYCMPLPGVTEWQAKTLLGVILSSLGRYRVFMTAGSWGTWHDSFVPKDLLDLPIRLADSESETTRRIATAVDDLSRSAPLSQLDGLPMEDWQPDRRLPDVLARLDLAVFDLFDLTPAERDLVRDFHTYTLDYATRKSASTALKPVAAPAHAGGLFADVHRLGSPLSDYLDAFLSSWHREMRPSDELSWQIVSSDRSGLLGAIFETRRRGGDFDVYAPGISADWERLMNRLAGSLTYPMSSRVQRSGTLRAVTDTSITLVKANEARLWTASSARQDAEATMLQAMSLGAT